MGSQVPPEVLHLLNHPEGRFLLVKGRAGTGKTMLCLELIRECGGLYVSTRVRAERLYADSPGLEESVPADFIMDAASEVDEKVLSEFLHSKPGKEFLWSLEPDMNKLPLPPLFKRILEKTEVAQIPFVVVIDSWDAIFAYSGSVMRKETGREWSREELQAVLLNVFRNRAVNIVMVEEGEGETQMDYLVDGIIELRRERWNERVVRVMHLRKTRGTEIQTPEYLFTLHGGRFRFFEPFVPKIPARPKKWKPMTDTEARFSAGCEDLDLMLGGGFKKGSSVLLEVGGSVPDDAIEQFIAQVSANFLAQNRAVLMVTPGGIDAETIAQRGARDVGEDIFNASVRMMEKSGGRLGKNRPYMVSLKFENIRQDFNDWMYLFKNLHQKTGQPVLEIVGIDTQEARYGEEVYKEILSISTEITRNEGNLTVRITRPGLESLTRRCANVSDVHLKMMELHGAVLLYLEKPRGGIHYFDTEAAGGNIRISLTPLA